MSSSKALLIVDVQVAPFIWHQYGGKELYNSEILINNINSLIDKARTSHIPVIYVQYAEADGTPRGKGMPLWEVHPQIKPQKGDITITKYHADPFYGTDLHKQLKSLGVTELIITGVQTEFCVDTACRTAFSLGYKNTLVSDGHSTFDNDIMPATQIIQHHNNIIGGLFADLKPAAEIEF